MLDTRPAEGPWDALVMAFHGRPNKLQFASGGGLHQRNVAQRSQGLQHALAPHAPVILYSCLTGSGEDNLAADFATALDRPVIAPSYYWLMQTALPLAQRTPELGFDDQRRLTVQASHFLLFYKSRLESGRDRYLIAPRAMIALCRQDGFVLRGSRSRPLFHRYAPKGLKRPLP